MYSVHNEAKYVVAERINRISKNEIHDINIKKCVD